MIGYIYAIIAVCAWGSVFTIAKFVIANKFMDPFVLAFWRFFWGWIFLLFIIKFNLKRIFEIFKKDPYTFLYLALSGVYFMVIFVFISLKTTSASVSSILLHSNPIFVLLISIMFLKEKVSLPKLIGIIIGFLGCLIVSKGNIFIFSWRGEKISIYPIFAAICWAIYTVLGEKPTKKYGATETTFIASFIGSIFLFLTVIALKLDIFGENIKGFLTGIYLGIIPTGIAFTLWFKALNYMKPSSLAQFQYLGPVTTLILSFFILKEVVSPAVILGMFLIFISFFLMQFDKSG